MILRSNDHFDAGPVAFVLIAALVQLALVWPGLTLFHVSLRRAPRWNDVSRQMLEQLGVLSLTWVLIGHSLSFGPSWGTVPQPDPNRAAAIMSLEETMKIEDAKPDLSGTQGRGGAIGGLDYLALQGVNPVAGAQAPVFPTRRPAHHLPHMAFLLLQLALFVVLPTPLLLHVADRQRLLFAVLWGLVVYSPIAHAVWGDGWLGDWGTLDFGGGMFQIALGGSAAMFAWMTRQTAPAESSESPETSLEGHAPWWATGGILVSVLGSAFVQGSLTWFADGRSATAMLNSLLGCGAGMFGFVATEKLCWKRESRWGLGAGAVCGLTSVAAGSGMMITESAIVVGAVAGILGGLFSGSGAGIGGGRVRPLLMWHGVSAGVGMLLLGLFATSSVGGFHWDGRSVVGLIEGNSSQMLRQVGGVFFAAVWGFFGTGICWLIAALVPRRATQIPSDAVQAT